MVGRVGGYNGASPGLVQQLVQADSLTGWERLPIVNGFADRLIPRQRVDVEVGHPHNRSGISECFVVGVGVVEVVIAEQVEVANGNAVNAGGHWGSSVACTGKVRRRSAPW